MKINLILLSLIFCFSISHAKSDSDVLIDGDGFYYSTPNNQPPWEQLGLGGLLSLSTQKTCMDYENQKMFFMEDPQVATFYKQETAPGLYKFVRFPTNNPKEILSLLPEMKGFVQANSSDAKASVKVGPIGVDYNSQKSNYYLKYGLYRKDYIKKPDGYYPAVIGIGYSAEGVGNNIFGSGGGVWGVFESSIKKGQVKGSYSVSSFGITNPHQYIKLGVLSESDKNIDDKRLSKLIDDLSKTLKNTSLQLVTLSPEIVKDIKLEPMYIAYGRERLPNHCVNFESFDQ